MKFSNIRLLVDDFDTSFIFYRDVLGLECTWGALGENYASFDIGIPSGLALFKAGLMNKAINSIAEESQAARDKSAIILQVDNVDDAYTTLQNRGVAFLEEPKDMLDWGIKVAHFRDPAGNLIELYSDLEERRDN